MTTNQKSSKKPAKEDVSYVGIPSIQATSGKQNNWWRSHNNTLQQIAAYTNYAIPFR